MIDNQNGSLSKGAFFLLRRCKLKPLAAYGKPQGAAGRSGPLKC